MNFEVQNALVTLDKRTPSFFVAEMFGQSDLTCIKKAAEALKDLDGTQTSKRLRSMLKIC
jgi:hypothetical protein